LQAIKTHLADLEQFLWDRWLGHPPRCCSSELNANAESWKQTAHDSKRYKLV